MLVIGSRGSKLALWQARWVAARLEETGWRCRIQTIRTTGDTVKDLALSKVGAKGLFTKQIEEALLEERIDLAVHSLKDLPTETPRGLVIGAVPAREDARDAMVGRKLAELPAGARVGTSSLRRAAQVRLLRRDLVVESIRGNLDTRLRKLDDGLYDAIVVAAAGLKRLGWEHRIAELLPVEQVCPAAGQGALAVGTRRAKQGKPAANSTTRRPGRRSPPNAPCSRRSAAAARFLLVPMPRRRTALSSCRPWSFLLTVPG